MADSEETERSESSERIGQDEETKASIAELMENMWTAVETGKDKELRKFFSKNEERDIPLNRDNEEFDEDGGHILIFCVKEGCSRGNSFGRDFVQCVRILLNNDNLDIDVQDKSERTALHWAVLGKNTQFTSLLMKAGADPTIHDHDGLSPFHIAVQKGYKELLKILACNQDKEIFSKKDGKGTPPLVTAVNTGNLEICRYLLENGAKIDATDRRLKRSALQYAILAKNLDIFDLLLKYNPSLDQGDYRGKTALHRICAIKDPRYFQRVIKHYGTFPDHIMEQETDDGVTPVISACQSGNSQQLKELIDQGAPISTKDDNGRTALHYCADNLETQCAEMLLAKDPSLLEVKDSQGFTPLHMSVISGNVPLLKLLLAKGADIRSLDSELHTPTHWATGITEVLYFGNGRQDYEVCGHLEILDILIDNGAELSSADSHNAYPIHYAAQMNGKDSNHADSKVGEKVLKKLLDSGVPHDVTDKDGRQPLLWAASAGNTESIKLLVKAGADVNAIDKDGLSALHCAASRGHSHCIEELKKLGADVNLADKNSCTPLFYAVTLGNKDCTKTLLKHGADPNHQDVRGRTPSHCASVKGCVETLKILDKSKADLWGSSGRGDFPIHEAAQGGHCDVVKYLLKWKNTPDAVNTPNNAGRTCLHISAIINNLPLCKLLLDNGAEKNSLMMHKNKKDSSKDKSYTPYDAAILKDNRETAEYIKSKGGNTGGDIDNILNKKDKRESKSAKSRKSNLESHKEEEENAEQDKKSEKQEETDKEEKPKSKKELEKEKKEAEKAKKEEEKKKKEEELKTKKEEEQKKKEEEKKQKEEEKKKKEEEKKQKEEEKKQKEEEKKQKEQESKTSPEETTDKKEEAVVAAAAAVVADEKEKKEEDKKGKKDSSKEDKNSKEGKGSKEVKDNNEKEQEKKKKEKEQKDPEKEDQLESDEEVVVVKGKKVVRKKKGYVKDKEAEKARKEAEEAKKDAVKANQEAEKAKANAEKAKLEKEQQDQKKKKSAKEKKEEKVESNKAKDKDKTKKDEKAVASAALAAKNKKGKKDPDTIQEEDEEEEDDTIKESPIEAEKAKRETEKSKKEAEKLRKEAEKANSEADKIKQAAVVAETTEEGKDTSKKKEKQTEKGGKGKEDKAPKTPSKGKKDSSKKEEISKDQKGKKDTTKTDTKPEESQKEKSAPATPKTPNKDVKEPDKDKDEEPEVKEKDKKEQDKNSSKDKKDKQDTKDLEKVEKSARKEENSSESKNKEKKGKQDSKDQEKVEKSAQKEEKASKSKNKDKEEKQDTKDPEKVDTSAHKEEKESESKNKKDNTEKPGTDKKLKDTKEDKSELQKEKSTVSKSDKSKKSSEQPKVDKEKTSPELKEVDKTQKKDSQSKSKSEEKSDKKTSVKNKSEDKSQEKSLANSKLEEKDKKSSEKSQKDTPRKKTPEKKQREEKSPRKTSGKLQQEVEDQRQTSEKQTLEENFIEDKVDADDEIDEREDSGVNTPGSLAEEEDLEKHLVAANIAAESEKGKKKNKSTNQPGPSTSTPKTKHRPKKEDNNKQKVSPKDSGKPISRERTEFQEVELVTNRDSGNHSQSEDRHSQTEDRHSQTEDRHSQTEGRQSQTKHNLVLSPSLSPVDYQEHKKDAFVETPKSRSAHTEKQDDEDEFEFPENSHENQEAALRLAESRKQSRQETVPDSSRPSDSPDRESRSRRKASKIPDTEVIQPGLKSRDNSRSKTPVLTNGHTQQNKDYVETSEEDDDVITEINFQNRLRRIEKAQLARNKQKEQFLLQQLRKTQKPNYKLAPVRSKNKSNLSLADMERLDNSGRRRNVPRRVASIQESVRRYQDQRRFVRQMHQLKRAQIYTGPMHDIVLFSKMMDVYKHSTPGGSENDLEMSTMDNWDSYLRVDSDLNSTGPDQLRFVSHYYDEDKSVRDQTNKVRRETADTRRGVESRSEYLAQSFRRKEEQDGREKTDLDGRISTLTRKTEDLYDSVKEKADQTLQDAKETNASLDKYYRKERSDLLHHSRPHSHKKLKDEEEMDERHRMHEEHEKARKEKHSEWHRKKDEELRRRLLKVYGNGSEINYGKSRNVGHMKSSTPRTNNSVGTSPGSRPKSMMSSTSGSRAQYSNSTDQELSVQMTEFGFRRVKKTDDGSYVPCSRHGSNWTPKFDGDVRPRAGLVFVEPKLYNEYLKEEAQVRHQTAMMARSRSTNINTLEDDATVLETVET
nr:titin homolog isoform X16 [Crassostrea gigas]